MNRQNIVDEAAKALQTKQDAEAAVRAVFNSIKKALNNNEKVMITGFGVFIPRVSAPRTARDPRTNKPMLTKSKRTVKFKPAPGLLK